MEAAQAKQLKVGELARSTGLTVRTLHHYDEIGLLKPSGVAPNPATASTAKPTSNACTPSRPYAISDCP